MVRATPTALLLPILAPLALTPLVPLNQAAGAPVDCARARSAMEKRICTDPRIAAADEARAAAYRQVLEQLSEPARALVRQGERQWVTFVETVCPPNREMTSCLAERYAERQAQLAEAVTKRADLTIYRVDGFEARPATRAAATSRHIAYPRLDRSDEAAGAFNRRMAALAKDASSTADGDEIDVDFELYLTLPQLVSGQFTVSTYTRGAAHPAAQLVSFKWLLAAGRDLRAEDLFDGAGPWRTALGGLCADAFADFDNRAEFCAPDKLDFDAWTIEAEGVGVQFQQYEIGPYAIGAPKEIIAWDKLSPWLVGNPPFPIPAP
jgi:uncharacterized protein